MGKKLLFDINFPQRIIESSSEGTLFEGDSISFLKKGTYVLLDMGATSCSGYTVFSVSSFKKEAKLRISYFDRLEASKTSEEKLRGDCNKGDADYLGVILPVFPANPHRFEDFMVNRTGEYIYPLIEGQYRYACITLIEGEEVTINSFRCINASKNIELDGFFNSDDSNLNALYDISARTIAIASVRANSFEYLKDVNKIVIHTLTKFDNKNIINMVAKNTISLSLEMAKLENDDRVAKFLILNENNEVLEGYNYELSGFNKIENIEITRNESFKIALLNQNNELYILHDLVVDGTKVNLGENNLISGYQGEYFVSDGAKRDRLPWTGDLDWASKSFYFTFNDKVMKDTLELTYSRQRSDGYYLATFYPEDNSPISLSDNGYYASDVFSLWNIVTYYRYLQYNDDSEFMIKYYEKMKKCLCHHLENVKENGLFFQVSATSKGTWDHGLNEGGYYTYVCILLSMCAKYMSEVAHELNKIEDEKTFKAKADSIKNAVETQLFDEKEGMYIKGIGVNELDNEASSLALAMMFTSPERAKAIKENYHKTYFIYGKIVSLFIEGLFNYGFTEEAFKLLKGKNEFTAPWGYSSYISWYMLPTYDNCPMTVSECMLPPNVNPDHKTWGDYSHPDCAINHILVGSIVGIKPIGFGFKQISFNPQFGDIKKLTAKIPSQHGFIEVNFADGAISINAPKLIKIS